MAVWPTAEVTFPTVENNVDTVVASHFNIQATEIIAIEQSLGVGFTGSFTVINSLWNFKHLPSGDHGLLVIKSTHIADGAVINAKIQNDSISQ